jgi:cytochrome c553
MSSHSKTLLLLAGLMLAVFTASAYAAGNVDAGEEKAVTCQACHGVAGAKSVTPDIPLLAGQHENYLAFALKAYRSGSRQQAVMATFAQQLSDQDIADLAAYFSAQDSSLRTARSGD